MVWLLWGVAKLCCTAKVNWVETWTHIWLLGSRGWRLELEVAHILLVGHRWLRLLCKEIIVCYSTVLLTLVEPRWGSHSHLEAQWWSIKRHMSLCAASSHIFVFILDLIVFWVEPLIPFICCDWRFHVLVGVSFWVLLHLPLLFIGSLSPKSSLEAPLSSSVSEGPECYCLGWWTLVNSCLWPSRLLKFGFF